MTRDQLMTTLRLGAQLHQHEAAAASDYVLDATSTEYLLTACLLRGALHDGRPARVEALQEAGECAHVYRGQVSPQAPRQAADRRASR